eukprot:90796-Chlamydomonas_euryale.AAC.6
MGSCTQGVSRRCGVGGWGTAWRKAAAAKVGGSDTVWPRHASAGRPAVRCNHVHAHHRPRQHPLPRTVPRPRPRP